MDSSDGLNVGDVTGPRWAGGTRNPDDAEKAWEEHTAQMYRAHPWIKPYSITGRADFIVGYASRDAEVEVLREQLAAAKEENVRLRRHIATRFSDENIPRTDYGDFKVWLAAHDLEVAARTLEAASDDYYGDTHIPGLSAMTWLRERAAALRSGTEGSGQ